MTVNERGNALSRVRRLLPYSSGDEDRRLEAERESDSCRWDIVRSAAWQASSCPTDLGAVYVMWARYSRPRPAEMALVERDDMVEHVAASTADPSFRNSVLPGTPHTYLQGFNAIAL